jgi:uncharacterized membrane protein YjfL (UPF0719 family)
MALSEVFGGMSLVIEVISLSFVSFLIAIVGCVISLKLLPKILDFHNFEDLVKQDNRGAGYYYIFAGLCVLGLQLLVSSMMKMAPGSVRNNLIGYFSWGFLGLILGIIIIIGSAHVFDTLTKINESDLVKKGNFAAGHFFVGAGLVVLAILYTVSSQL